MLMGRANLIPIIQHVHTAVTKNKSIADRASMSRVLESESDNDESGRSSMCSSTIAGAQQQEVNESSTSDNNTNLMQRKLEHFSRRLSMLGLIGSEENERQGDSNAQLDLIETGDPDMLHQEVPMTTSLLLNKLPKVTNKALERSQKAEKIEADNLKQQKIQIKFQPIGSIAQIKPSVCKISAAQPFALVTTFLTKSLKVNQVYCYINSSFAPNPQQIVGDLWSQFKVDNELIVSYCGTVAFG